MSNKLSHIDEDGSARMVDVAAKDITRRRAIAEAYVRCNPVLIEAIKTNSLAKGDLLGCARLAGIMAAKRVDELIPLCHTLALDQVAVEAEVGNNVVHLTASATTSARTGVEMEALTAVSIAALTVIDMGKAIDKGIVIESIRLLEKTGGRSGNYRVPD